MNNRKQQLMQDALDTRLSPEDQAELQAHLQSDPEAATEYTHLQRVDMLLREAPHERAPQRLALTIMARIAETVKKQEMQADGSADPLMEASINLAMQLVTVATLPVLVGASTLILNAQADPELIDALLQQVAGLMILVLDVLKVLLEEAEAVYAEDPEMALALLALIPPTLLALVQQVMGDEGESDDHDNTGGDR